MESRKIEPAGQQWRCKHREWTCGQGGVGEGEGDTN